MHTKSDITYVRPADIPTDNLYGNFWNSIRGTIYAIDGLRARNGTFNTPWEYYINPAFTTPQWRFVDYNLADIYDQRALELANIARTQNKKICIMWSGGIDSTSVLASFIKNLNTSDLKNICVILSLASIEENTQFYQKFIQGKLECMPLFELNVCDKFLNENILITGDPGNGLFGPSQGMYKHLLEDNRYKLPWQDNTDLIKLGIHSKTTGFANWYVGKITKNLLEVNLDGVETIADWWWWHYINFKWEFSITRPLFYSRHNPKESISQENSNNLITCTFYNTEKFQLWSYSNLKNHVRSGNLKEHKLIVKKYIFDLDHDIDYLENKLVVQSLPKNKEQLKILPLYYTKDWVAHYESDPVAYSKIKTALDDYTG